jgi:hypothetical protein
MDHETIDSTLILPLNTQYVNARSAFRIEQVGDGWLSLGRLLLWLSDWWVAALALSRLRERGETGRRSGEG